MTLTKSSTGLTALTFGVAALVAIVFATVSVAPAHAASICPGTTFSANLRKGSTGMAVMQLQQFLNSSPDTMIASVGAGSPGNETTYLGGLTTAAIKKFQTKYASNVLAPVGLSVATGYWGASSRAEANALCAGTAPGTNPGTGTTTPGTAAGTAVVSAAVQPANSIAPKNAARVPFTSFTVTANGAPVTINSVTVQRQGPSLDTDFSGVVLLDASTGVQVGVSRTFDSNHNATVGSPITIPAGTSKTFTVAGNVAAAPGSGDIATLAVTAINTSSSVSGSLPIVGASNTFNNNLTIGTVTVSTSSFDPNSATSQPIGTTGYRFSGLRLTAGSAEDLTFKSITWYQSGSANSVSNVQTVVNGTSYPTTLDSTGRYYTTVFPSGIVIPKGTSVDVYVTGDLGSNTVPSTVAEFDIYRNTDVYLVGNTYGYGVTAAVGTNSLNTAATHGTTITTSSNPWFQGSTVSITAGSISTIQNATSVPAQNVALNVLNQPLGGFQTNLLGEAITAQSVKVHFNYGSTAATTNLLTNVTLVNENGQVVAGPYDGVAVSGTEQTVTFSGSINFPTGLHTYTVKGELPTGVTNGDTIQASTTPSLDWSSVTGNITGNTITLPSTPVTMNKMTVKSAALNITNGNTPVSQTIVAGGNNVTLATINLDASQSGEDVRLTSVPLDLTFSATTTKGYQYLSACQLYNGSTPLNTGSNVVNSANISTSSGGKTAFALDSALTIPKGTVVTLSLQCNVSPSATGTYSWAVDTGTSNDMSTWSVSGSTSGNSVTPTDTSVGTAPTMTTTGTGSLAFSLDPSSPAYSLAAGGSTGVTLNVLQLRATNEPVNLSKIGLTLTTATASSSASDLSRVYLYAGNNLKDTAGNAITPGTLLGTATFTGNATVATSTLTTQVQTPSNQNATIVVKGDIANIGTSQPATEGHLVAVDYLNSQGTGASSGNTVYGTGSTASAGVRIFYTVPTFALDTSLPSTGIGDGRLMEFKVTADPHGPVGIDQFKFTLSTTTLSVTNVQLFVYTDAGYSVAASGNFGVSTGQFGQTVTNPVSGTAFKIQAQTNPLEIPAGQTYYFKLIGSIAANQTGASVVTTLNGDSAFPSLSGFTTTASALQSGNSFVWSPNSTTTANITSDVDWTNGYGIVGLPASGLIQSRSN